jgi:type II secretory pathway pseudopilin PulG
MPSPTKHGQRGFTLLLFALLVIGIGASVFLSVWNGTRARLEREKNTALALQQAEEALIAHAATPSDINLAGYLPLPDIGIAQFGAIKEGGEAGNFLGNNKDYSAIGKLPWASLGIPPLYDQSGECLWYIVSGRFKNNPKTSALNWDTQGQIDIIDGNGTLIASNIAAVAIAPGPPVDGQSRNLADAAYTRCGGNYQAANYLDPINAANAVAGEVNYFAGSTNGQVASNDGNKKFIMASGSPFINDRLLLITVDDIFRPIIRRSDFMNNLLNNFQEQIKQPGFVIAGPKGTDNLTCKEKSTEPSLCRNWKEMFFVTQLRDDEPRPPNCARVIIFAGQKKPGQNRITPDDRQNKANYLEGANLAAFATPIAATNNFDITLPPPAFMPDEPWKDIVYCIPEAP